MSKIHLLDPSIYNQISAGEVIEKPASVVKELVENAIDAGAKHVTVEVSGGGLERIAVSDDGSGIAKDELQKVFLPHATSKISEQKDLFCISTLGFRGEAMASIAAVSRVRLTSCVEGESAYCIELDGGVVQSIEPAGGNRGTLVEVFHLFYHTPARLKFMRSVKTEQRDITGLVADLMIANPSVAITYIADGKKVYQSHGAGLEDVVNTVFDGETTAHLLPVSVKEYGYEVVGFVSDTLYSRGTKSGQIVVINGRIISNTAISAAINNAYRDHLMKRSFPVAVLQVTLPVEEVDVNVHPTKADVRFQYASKVIGFIYRAITRAIDASLAEKSLQFDSVSVAADTSSIEVEVKPALQEERPIERQIEHFGESIVREENTFAANYQQVAPKKPVQPVLQFDIDALLAEQEEKVAEQTTIVESKPKAVESRLQIIGQVLSTYIVAEMDGAMLLIDQHAAAERVLYDKLVATYATGEIALQPLLIPYEFSLDYAESERLDERIEALSSIGVHIQATAEGCYSLSAVPAILADNLNFKVFVQGLLADDFNGESIDVLKDKLAYAACRSAIKGNTHMSREALELLIKSLFAHGIPAQCPHGRPAYVRLTAYELEKMFKRKV